MNKKNIHELEYWINKKIEEGGKFKNAQLIDGTNYEYFYTEFFGLKKSDFKNKVILDIGCGPRGTLDWISEKAKCFGLDPLAVEYKKLNPKINMEMIRGNLETFESNINFDYVSTFNSLDHVDDLSKSIENLYTLCSPNGTLLLIADIHDEPTTLEPSAFSWNISKVLIDKGFEIETERHFEKYNALGMYQSLLDPIQFDHSCSEKRYGIIAIKAKVK